MKHFKRVLLIAAMMGSSLLGGFLGSAVFAPGAARAAPREAAMGQTVKTTELHVPAESTNFPEDFGTTPRKIADIGKFTVENGDSLVEVVYNGRVKVDNMTGSAVIYQLRVDGRPGETTNLDFPTGMAVVRSSEKNQFLHTSMTGIWQGLSDGEHTLSMWVYAWTGTGYNAYMNPEGWPSTVALVKEYLPFGSTYIPVIIR